MDWWHTIALRIESEEMLLFSSDEFTTNATCSYFTHFSVSIFFFSFFLWLIVIHFNRNDRKRWKTIQLKMIPDQFEIEFWFPCWKCNRLTTDFMSARLMHFFGLLITVDQWNRRKEWARPVCVCDHTKDRCTQNQLLSWAINNNNRNCNMQTMQNKWKKYRYLKKKSI